MYLDDVANTVSYSKAVVEVVGYIGSEPCAYMTLLAAGGLKSACQVLWGSFGGDAAAHQTVPTNCITKIKRCKHLCR